MANDNAVCNRREFLAAVAAGSAPLLAPTASSQAPSQPARVFERKIKLGVVGCGGRGGWLAGLFNQHGGYTIHAVADYFQEAADRCGDALGVDRARRFSGLSAYRKLMESGVEAVALETPPYFFPEHAAAAAEAGLHIYMAKPVAVDVPGCNRIEAAARKAGANRRCFLVDYQMPTDPSNIEVVRKVHAGAIGKPVLLRSYYLASMFADPPLTSNVESRLQKLIWVNDVALGASYHVNACIHAIDAALWMARGVPTAAMGLSQRGRPNPHGDSHDAFSLTFEFPDDLILQHHGKHLPDQYSEQYCGVLVHGQAGHAQITYSSKASYVSGSDASHGDVVNLYEAGARRNIATFYDDINLGRTENPTVRRAVDSCLTCILGREAARRRTRLTMAQLLKENRRIELDLKGLKA